MIRGTMPSRTIFLSRLLGLYCLLVAIGMMIHRQLTVETVTALLHDAPLMFIVGIMALAAGLAIVLAHNVWSGGVLPVVITVIGWLSLIKGLLFVFLTPDMEADLFLDKMHYGQLFYIYAGISLFLGVYLTYCGFVGDHLRSTKSGMMANAPSRM